MVTWSLTKELKLSPISVYKAQVQVDQGPPHKTRYIDSNRKESEEESWVYGCKGKFPEQNNNRLCSKIKNWQMGLDKIT